MIPLGSEPGQNPGADATHDDERAAFASALEADTSERPGTRVGPYKLLQAIGEGGFGMVWMAEQQEPIRRRVALKIIKPGMGSREVIARFETERQALALMDHPNIARVFDAGTTARGTPYFVMELVRGVPITRYCDDNRLGPAERLRLFIAVCQAVQHAHQKGVIHRDLKPSNILITLHDGVPVPKVIDFGIAKATSTPLTDKTLFTRFHAFLGTPVYTSPEQMEMSSLDVDTRSDIYSLGVLLYELLAGRPPFDPEALAKAGIEAMCRAIRETAPLRPSQRLRTLSDQDRTTVARQRSMDAARLSLLLRGDLDWIVLRCLEKDRTRRYPTASEIAADIGHYLANRPVAARPPSTVYRLGKFLRRHRLGATAAAAITASLVSGLLLSATMLLRERAARERADTAERAEAALRHQAEEARRAEQRRAAATALYMADRHLADGTIADGLAYLVHAARLDPHDRIAPPRIASVLASNSLLLPKGPTLDVGPGYNSAWFTPDGKHLEALGSSGRLAALDLASGSVQEIRLPAAINSWTVIDDSSRLVGILCRDDVLRVVDREEARVVREMRFPSRPLGAWAIPHRNGGALVWLEDQSWHFADIESGRLRPFGLHISATIAGFFLQAADNGRWAAVSTGTNSLEVWNLDTGERQSRLEFLGTLTQATFSPDSTRLLTVSTGYPRAEDLSVKVWSVPGLEPMTGPDPEEVPLNTNTHSWARISPDGRWVVVSGSGGRVVFELATGRRAGPIVTSPAAIADSSPRFSRDGRRFSAFVDGGIQVFDTASGEPVTPLMPHGGGVRDRAFSMNGSRLLTLGIEGVVRVWDIPSGRLLAQPVVRAPKGFTADFSPDGEHLAVVTAEGPVHLFRIRDCSARPLTLPRRAGAPMPAPFLPEDPPRLLWLGHDRARVLDVASGREVTGGFTYPEPISPASREHPGPIVSVDFGYMVVFTRRGEWQAWKLGPAGVDHVTRFEDSPASNGWACISPKGDVVAILDQKDLTRVRFWDLATGRPIGRTCVAPASIYFPRAQVGGFSPDGRHFIAGAVNGDAIVWEIATGSVRFEFRGAAEERLVFAGYSPDGSRIGTASVMGCVRLWDASTGRQIGESIHHQGKGLHLQFSPDSTRLVTGSADRTARVWDARDASPVSAPMTHRGGLRWVEFSPDGSRVASSSGDATARVWDATSGQPLTEPLVHLIRVPAVRFSPDTHYLCTETAGTAETRTSFHLWSVPPAPDGHGAPDWLLRLATLCAGRKVDEHGRCVDALESLAGLDEIRRTVSAPSTRDPYVAWGRWLLDPNPDRSIAPGFTIARAEAEALAAALLAEPQVP